MMMFTRLKNRPIETIMFFVTFNLVAVILVAIKAARLSPEILGFSVAAALAGCAAIAMIAIQVDAPLRRLAKDDDDSQLSRQQMVADTARADEIGALAREISRLRREPATRQADQEEALARLEDALRRLSNGDLSCLLYVSFPEKLDGLRVRFNRLASMMNVNLSAAHRSTTALREHGRASQGDLAVIGERIAGALPAAQKANGALDVLNRAAHTRHRDADTIARRLAGIAEHGTGIANASTEALSASEAAGRSLDSVSQLVHSVGSLTIKAEELATVLADKDGRDGLPPNPQAAVLARQLADAGMATTQDLLIHTHEMEQQLSDSTRHVRSLTRDAVMLAGTIETVAAPVERLARNVELEVQRLSLAHMSARETEIVLSRTHEIVQASENAMVRIMSEASAIDTRLSLFSFVAPGRPEHDRLPGEKSHLRSVT